MSSSIDGSIATLKAFAQARNCFTLLTQQNETTLHVMQHLTHQMEQMKASIMEETQIRMKRKLDEVTFDPEAVNILKRQKPVSHPSTVVAAAAPAAPPAEVAPAVAQLLSLMNPMPIPNPRPMMVPQEVAFQALPPPKTVDKEGYFFDDVSDSSEEEDDDYSDYGSEEKIVATTTNIAVKPVRRGSKCHPCNFQLKNNKFCTRKVSNKYPRNTFCFLHHE